MNENRQVKDVVEYLQVVSKIKTEWPNSALVFRGQKNEEWPLASSAERRLKTSLLSQNIIPDRLFIEYHEDLLKKCKLKNYDQREQKQLDDLELLAGLQHHGAATCLIDFTRNALVALWFACQKSDNADGKVFVVNIADRRTFWEITHKHIENNSISDILQFKPHDTGQDQATGLPTPETFALLPNKRGFWHWTPAHLNERITAQHSLFLFGLPSSEKLRSKEIIIASASKEQIRKELKALHDICEESLFPDFVGFAYIQRADAPYPIPDAEEYILRGAESDQRGQYSEAIVNFTKAIELKPDYAEAYYARGHVYGKQGEYDQAIANLTKAIELKPDYAQFYYFRGLTYSGQGEHDQAIQDFTKAIELNPKLAEAYCFRGFVYEGQDEHDLAIQDSTKAIELESDYAKAYAIRGLAWLHLKKWQEAKSDLTTAKDMGLDIVDSFQIDSKRIADFEQKTKIKLPEDIAAMLTESEN